MAEGPKPASRIGRAVGLVLLIVAAGGAGYLLRPLVAEWLAAVRPISRPP
jgi:hypothetical protein